MTVHEEVLKLRALVKQQQTELEEQRGGLEAKERIIEKQNIQIENMIQALLHARKKLFGASTEVTKGVDGQLSLFETAQELAQELTNEQKKITIREYKRTPRQPGVRAEMLAGLPQEVEEYIIPRTDTCPVCQSELKVIGKRVIRTEVEFVPAKLIVKQIVQEVAKCTKCGTASSENPNTNELLTKALNYSKNQRKYLETFLEDGRLPISNNLCEANIKPYATARRAWLFADTPKGARANAVLYTLVESARANGLDVYEYLKYLLTEMPNNRHLEQPDILDHYLPWSKELPAECKLKHKYKKCFKK